MNDGSITIYEKKQIHHQVTSKSKKFALSEIKGKNQKAGISDSRGPSCNFVLSYDARDRAITRRYKTRKRLHYAGSVDFEKIAVTSKQVLQDPTNLRELLNGQIFDSSVSNERSMYM